MPMMMSKELGRTLFFRLTGKISMSKRKKVILTSIILSLGLLFTQTRPVSQRYLAILFLSVASFLLSAWTLWERLKSVAWLEVLLLPTLFTAGISLFYFLLPSRLLARLPVVGLFGLGIYVLLLTENIFSVASFRNIQLLRSAQATSFLMSLITAFLLFDTVFSFRLEPWLNFSGIFIIGFLLFYQGLWSVKLEKKPSPKLRLFSLILALVLAEVALAISFWPLAVSTSSLFLITVLYLLLGLVQSEFQGRLFKKTVREYLWIVITVFLIIFFTTRWGR